MNRVLTREECKYISNNKEKSNPTCTVLLSAYNGEKYIEQQLNSILRQEGVDVSLIIRDDGSTDSTAEIINAYKKLYKNKIEIIRGKNVGIHESFRELLLQDHRSQYIAFADQDDIWDRDKLIIGISALSLFGANFYSCASRLIDSNNLELGSTTSDPEKYRFYMNGNSKILTPGAQGCTMILDNNFLTTIINRGVPSKYGHDTWIPIIAYYYDQSIYDPMPHMSYRQHDDSWTGNRSKKVKQLITETEHFLKGLKRYTPLAQDILQRYKDALSLYDLEVIMNISGNSLSFANRMKAIRKYQFGKYGIKENIIYRLYYLLHIQK